MSSSFGGWTAEQYVRYRRDVPDVVVDQLVRHFQLRETDRVLDLGAGTGESLLPLARRVGLGVGLDPESDMLRLLRNRARTEQADLVTVLGSDQDLPAVRRLLGDNSISLVTVANALHWMDAAHVFTQAHRLLRPGGGIAVVSHGIPLWLGEAPWAKAVHQYLQDWLGKRNRGMCGVDDTTRDERTALLRTAGFLEVAVLRHHYQAVLTPEYVIGHLYSALSADNVPVERRAAFEAGVRSALKVGQPTDLIEDVPVVTLVGLRK